jgi:hypothetical protein
MTHPNEAIRTLELFAGTKSFSKVAGALGHYTHTVDNDASLDPDEVCDIRKWEPISNVDMLWASPPCQGFSVAAIGKNWNHDNTPKTDSARLGVELVQTTLDLIDEIQPTWYFIENPRGKLRKLGLLDHLIQHTVTYCQYGDTRMKPTDIWTNAHWWKPKTPCKNGMSCHVSAPRGSRTGTQGIVGAKDRGTIPEELFIEIFNQHKEYASKRSNI